MAPGQIIQKTITIDAATAKVWEVLTIPGIMKKWMSEKEIEITTDWKAGNPITIRGTLENTSFENKGIVLQFEPGQILRYSHLSSLSGLPDSIENYSVIEFICVPNGEQVILTLTLHNFPTEIICKHLDFYWNGTLALLKRFIENREEQ